MKLNLFLPVLIRLTILLSVLVGYGKFSESVVSIVDYLFSYGISGSFSAYVLIRLSPFIFILFTAIIAWQMVPMITKALLKDVDPEQEVNINRVVSMDSLITILGVYMILNGFYMFVRGLTYVFIQGSSHLSISDFKVITIYGSLSMFAILLGVLMLKKKELIKKVIGAN